MESINIKEQSFSILGKGSRFTGEFFLSGPVHLNSKIQGELTMEDTSLLIVEREGSFKGNIKCHDIEIFGHFEGIINSTGKVIIHPPASVTGEINAIDLVIYPGANINADTHTLEQQ